MERMLGPEAAVLQGRAGHAAREDPGRRVRRLHRRPLHALGHQAGSRVSAPRSSSSPATCRTTCSGSRTKPGTKCAPAAGAARRSTICTRPCAGCSPSSKRCSRRLAAADAGAARGAARRRARRRAASCCRPMPARATGSAAPRACSPRSPRSFATTSSCAMAIATSWSIRCCANGSRGAPSRAMKIVIAGGTGFWALRWSRRLPTRATRLSSSRADCLPEAHPQCGTSTGHPTAGPARGHGDRRRRRGGQSRRRIDRRRTLVRRAETAHPRQPRARDAQSGAAIAAANAPPPVFVSGSAVGYYGPRGDELVTEASPAGADFLARVCVRWEAEAARASGPTVRVVVLRTGLVLERERRGAAEDAAAVQVRRRRTARIGPAVLAVDSSRRLGRSRALGDRRARAGRTGQRHGPRSGDERRICAPPRTRAASPRSSCRRRDLRCG